MTIQYIMLVSLGFLIASLITLLLAPIFWHRAVRITNSKLRQSLPLSEQEILADKDQLRAKYAIRVHQLEKQVEQASLGGARQKIDLNRRDASIGQLETGIARLKSDLEESQNARGVLEQTVGDRIPKIEAKLEEARKLLVLRDHEVADLSKSSRRQQEALDEARVINQKQASDIERLRSQVLAYEAQSRKGAADGDFDGELAIRTELEMLRARAHDQASVIDRLNAEISVSRANSAAASSSSVVAMNGSTPSSPSIFSSETDGQIADLRREIAVLQTQLEQAKAVSDAFAAQASKQTAGIETGAERELRAAKAQAEDQAAEITRLRAELAAAVSESGVAESAVPSLRDNRIALKARLSGLEAKSNQQGETIQRLRGELAQANERAARQAANFMDEMRRLGVAAHVTQPRTGRPAGPQDTTRARNITRRTQAVFEASRGAGLPGEYDGRDAGQPAIQSVPSLFAKPALGRRLAASSHGDSASVDANADASAGKDVVTEAAPPPARVSNLVAAMRGGPNGAAAGVGQAGAPASTLSSAAGPATVTPSQSETAPRAPRLVDRLTAADGKP